MILEDNVRINPEEDELGRRSLVELLHKSILAQIKENHASITFGILGAWGEGKSSFMRMTQTLLDHDSVKTIWYDPWDELDERKMIIDFFSLLAHKLYANRDIEIAINSYGRAFLSKGDPLLTDPVFSSSVARLAKCIPFNPYSLAEAKEKISQQLRKLNEHIVVFIDDIDRLDSEEVHIVLRLIRQVADFDNIVYVLGLDPDVTSAILSEKIDNNQHAGRTYLNKVIQVPLVLPPIKEDILKDLISSNLKSLVTENRVNTRKSDISRISSFAAEILNTKRDIIRYINQLNLILPVIHHETDFVDLCLLELIKNQSEEGWLDIYRNQEGLLQSGGDPNSDTKKEEFTSCIDTITDKFPPKKQPQIKNLITNVLFGDNHYSPASKSIKNKTYFYQYFICGVPNEIIPHEDVLVMKKALESNREKSVLSWINSKARRYSPYEVDRACRTSLALIQDEGKKTEQPALTMCKKLASSTLSKNYSFDSISNPNKIDLTISCFIIPFYLGTKKTNGEFEVNRILESSLLREIYENAPVNFAMNVLQGVYSSNGIAPADEKETFDVLKNRVIEKNPLTPFKYSYVLQDSFFRTWKQLNDTEYYSYMKNVLGNTTLDSGSLIVNWLESSGKNIGTVYALSELFFAIPNSLFANLEKSPLRNHELVHYFIVNSPLVKKTVTKD